jgi:bifunctional enzyme CysN/CysC
MMPSMTDGDSVHPFHVAIVGHVDHGKSTLVGRLLHETGALPEGKLAEVEAVCRRRNMPFEWAFVTDALQPERDQGITIDVSYIRFRTKRRGYVLVDAPGHREFLKNMITGAAACDGAILVVDAAEGVREQTRRHGYLLALMGVAQVAVAVTKMDLIGCDRARFDGIAREVRSYLADIGVMVDTVIPVSARDGDNIGAPSARMAWYDGPTVLEALDRFEARAPLDDMPLRIPVQDVYRFDQRRIIAGRVETGRLKVGDALLFSPSNLSARVKAIESWNRDGAPMEGRAGESVGFTLEDQIFVERGEIASHVDRAPIETNVFRARLFWLGKAPLARGRSYTLKLCTRQIPVEVQSIDKVIDTSDLSASAAERVERNAVAEVVLRTRAMLALDSFADNPRTGRFVLVDGYDVVGGGIISMEGYPNQRQQITVRSTNVSVVAHGVTEAMRARQNRHSGGVLWLTGLSGAGKSTLAIALEMRLFKEGYLVYVLDGDNVRRGLNANLGFSPEDRSENIRRVGEVAALFAEAGFICVTAFISPYRSDRDRARTAGGGKFHEIYVKADLSVCEGRDPKGLYKRARRGEIADFTGISAPYEEPAAPELVLDTGAASVEDSLKSLLDYVKRNFRVRD